MSARLPLSFVRVENSFIPVPGIGETTERRLWRAGVTHWDHFNGPAVKGVGPTRAERIAHFIDEARDRLDAGDARFFADSLPSGSRWRLFRNFDAAACYLDIETTGLSPGYHEVTTVSLHRDGETTTLIRGQDLTGPRLASELADSGLLVTFNGAQFDVPFLERAFDLRVETPHVDLRYPCNRVGLSGGLKNIERDLGIGRDRPDIDGREAVRLWHRYEAGDETALETLVSYNREDTRNLADVADAVVDRLHEQVFERAVRGDGMEDRTDDGGEI